MVSYYSGYALNVDEMTTGQLLNTFHEIMWIRSKEKDQQQE